jgi:hypothetical protein
VCNGGCVGPSQGAAAAAAPPVLRGSGGARFSAKPPSVENERVDRVRAGGFCALANPLRARPAALTRSAHPSEIQSERVSGALLLPSGELLFLGVVFLRTVFLLAIVSALSRIN